MDLRAIDQILRDGKRLISAVKGLLETAAVIVPMLIYSLRIMVVGVLTKNEMCEI